MSIILLGAPGSGKGTQSDILAKRLGLIKISTGDVLRSYAKDDSKPISVQLNSLMSSGMLVSDEVVNEIVADFIKTNLSANSNCSFILDGFPRNVEQAEFLGRLEGSYRQGSEFAIKAVILLEITQEHLLSRVENRTTCEACGAVYNLKTNPPKAFGVCDICGGKRFKTRSDDNAQALINRLHQYNSLTAPLIEFYKSKRLLHVVDASLPIESVTLEALKYIN